MNYAQRIEREDEGDRIRAMLTAEASESDTRIRAAFHTAASGLMAWKDSPELTPRAYRRLEAIPDGRIYRPEGKETHYGTAAYADPYDVETNCNERGI